MNESQETPRELETRNNELAAELTSRVYPLLLQHGLKEAWLTSELTLWALLCAAVKEWSGRWRLASLMGNSNGLRDFVAADIARRTFVIIQIGGSGRPPRELRVAVVKTCCGVLRGEARPSERPAPCDEHRRPIQRVRKLGKGNQKQKACARVLGTL